MRATRYNVESIFNVWGRNVFRWNLSVQPHARMGEDGPCVAFLMFNPSTADRVVNELHTISKVHSASSKIWGYGRMVVVNLYAVRSRDPEGWWLVWDHRRWAPLNNYWIREAIKESRELICAWGCAQHMPSINTRIKEVMQAIRDEDWNIPINCLGYRKDWHPEAPTHTRLQTHHSVPFVWRQP